MGSLNHFIGSIWNDESNRGQRLRRLALAGGWQAWKRLVRKPRVVRLFNGIRFRAYPDCKTSSGVFYTRIPNSKCIEFLRQHIDGGLLIDIGANVGLVSMLLADKVEHALLFEPNPQAAARSRENIALNHLRFEVHEIALSDESGTIELENSGGVNAANRTVAGFETSEPTITVLRQTLDDFLATRTLPSNVVVKIDVEGHENSVLRGMRGFLATRRPCLVMFEYLARTNLAETVEILASTGYRIIELRHGKPAWAKPPVAPLQDLFACPEELAAEMVPA